MTTNAITYQNNYSIEQKSTQDQEKLGFRKKIDVVLESTIKKIKEIINVFLVIFVVIGVFIGRAQGMVIPPRSKSTHSISPKYTYNPFTQPTSCLNSNIIVDCPKNLPNYGKFSTRIKVDLFRNRGVQQGSFSEVQSTVGGAKIYHSLPKVNLKNIYIPKGSEDILVNPREMNDSPIKTGKINGRRFIVYKLESINTGVRTLEVFQELPYKGYWSHSQDRGVVYGDFLPSIRRLEALFRGEVVEGIQDSYKLSCKTGATSFFWENKPDHDKEVIKLEKENEDLNLEEPT